MPIRPTILAIFPAGEIRKYVLLSDVFESQDMQKPGGQLELHTRQH